MIAGFTEVHNFVNKHAIRHNIYLHFVIYYSVVTSQCQPLLVCFQEEKQQRKNVCFCSKVPGILHRIVSIPRHKQAVAMATTTSCVTHCSLPHSSPLTKADVQSRYQSNMEYKSKNTTQVTIIFNTFGYILIL